MRSPAPQRTYDEYALVLDEAPLCHDGGRLSLRAQVVSGKQTNLRRALDSRGLQVTASVRNLLDAVIVRVPRNANPDFSGLPHVKYWAKLRVLKPHLNTALGLVQVTNAWANSKIGGPANAGAGVKIAIVDSGIDDLNPAFSGANLSLPSGYPLGDTAYTNNKILVARSYVSLLNDANSNISSPDDTSPVDHFGHGTAVAMIAAGETVTGPAATITGVAPAAWIGNYKIYGSPGINEFPTEAALLQALDDAYSDGMQIVVLSSGGSALYGPLTVDANCPATPPRTYIAANTCDVTAAAVENAVVNGNMVVVTSAGDDGAIGNVTPTLGTINSPGDAPDAITVGATTNSHMNVSLISASGTGLSSNLSQIQAEFGEGTVSPSTFSASLVAAPGDGFACSPLPVAAGSLNNDVVLVERGNCDFVTKANNVAAAGAIGIIVYLDNPTDTIFVPVSLEETYIPVALIDNASGTALLSALKNTSVTVALDPAIYQIPATADVVASYSSRGPSIGIFDSAAPVTVIKPDLAATGSDLYTITQTLDPNGPVYSPDGFASVSGTSFAAPLVAGAVALVEHANPGFTAAQLKSAVVNTATLNVSDNGQPARVNAVGAGLLDANDALNVAVTVAPTSLDFGPLNIAPYAVGESGQLSLTNVTGATETLTLTVNQRDFDGNAQVTLSPASLTLSPGQTNTVTVAINGSLPNPGNYEGQINITGAGPALHVPYQYLVASGTPYYIFPLSGDGITYYTNSTGNELIAKVLDQAGVPVALNNVAWKVDSSEGQIASSDTMTDEFGIVAALVNLGPDEGVETFEVDAGSLSWQFNTTALNGAIVSGAVNAASFTSQIAPGSFMAIFGTELAATTEPYVRTGYFPLSMVGTSVSFDTTDGNVSVPGALIYVSPAQVNVQVPWELAGETSAVVKVSSYGGLPGTTFTINLQSVAPGIFGYNDPATNEPIAAALDPSYQPVTSANPIARGNTLQLYLNGLGPTSPAQVTGYRSSTTQLTMLTSGSPTVTIGGQTAQVQFAGLSPGSIALDQLNVTVPSQIATGYQPVVISLAGQSSQTSYVYVK